MSNGSRSKQWQNQNEWVTSIDYVLRSHGMLTLMITHASVCKLIKDKNQSSKYLYFWFLDFGAKENNSKQIKTEIATHNLCEWFHLRWGCSWRIFSNKFLFIKMIIGPSGYRYLHNHHLFARVHIFLCSTNARQKQMNQRL